MRCFVQIDGAAVYPRLAGYSGKAKVLVRVTGTARLNFMRTAAGGKV
jgi:hypothetical protein